MKGSVGLPIFSEPRVDLLQQGLLFTVFWDTINEPNLNVPKEVASKKSARLRGCHRDLRRGNLLISY